MIAVAHRVLLVVVTGTTFCCYSMEKGKLPVDNRILQLVHNFNLEKNKGYVECSNKPQLILLSGCAGMGKSELSHGLQKRTNALIYHAYNSREKMRDEGCFHVSLTPQKKVAKILTTFSFFVGEVQKNVPNKAIIFDESIDRQEPAIYDMVSKIAAQHKLPIFLIRLTVPKKIAFDRLMLREKDSPENQAHFKQHFDNYYSGYESFGDQKKDAIDYTQANEGDGITVDKKLVQEVEKRIAYSDEH